MNSFLCKESDGKVMVDKVFKAAVACNEAKKIHGDIVVDATLGTLFDEDGVFVAFDSVWNNFSEIDNIQKAKYASSIQGNPEFRNSVYNWLFGGLEEEIPCEIIATPGGAGAISSTMKNILNIGETIIIPDLAWGPYKTMAHEFGLTLTKYNMFDGNSFDLTGFKEVLTQVMETQGKVLVIINDPCHNPSGYTLTDAEWSDIMDYAGELSKMGPVVLLNDIAYVDFNAKGNEWKKGFSRFNNLPKNVMAIIAFSISKTLTAYGARCGAQIAISNDKEQLESFKNAAIYSARSIWSTVNNSAMRLFSLIMDTPHLQDAYMKEKKYYVDLLKDRSDIFVTEANQIGLPIYPYKEGFFVTLIMKDVAKKEAFNKKLQENYIYTVEVDGGLRIAICSVPKRKLVGLAKKIKALM